MVVLLYHLLPMLADPDALVAIATVREHFLSRMVGLILGPGRTTLVLLLVLFLLIFEDDDRRVLVTLMDELPGLRIYGPPAQKSMRHCP